MIEVKHSLTAVGTNNPARQVSVAAWNNDHVLTGTANTLLGFDGSGNGTEIDPSTVTSAWIVATRAALASAPTLIPTRYLREAGREGTFVYSTANNAANVTNDPQQGVYVAPASDTTGASGAWVRKFTGAKVPEWFGAVGDGTTNDAVALQAWLDSSGNLAASGKYYSTAKLIVRKSVTINGQAPGDQLSLGSAASGFSIRYVAGVEIGLDIQPHTTVTDPLGDVSRIQEGAYGSVIKNLTLVGVRSGASAVGLYCRTYVHLENVNAFNFQGKGIDCSASTAPGDGNSEYGNMSNSTITDCGAYNCGSHGLHIRGRDANGIRVSNFTAFGNSGWGILNESLIGNTFLLPNCAGNTLGAIKVPGNVPCTIVLPWIETGVGNNAFLNNNCIVIGADLSSINTGGSPTCLNGTEAKLGRVTFSNVTAGPEAMAAEDAKAYRYDGLYLQGRGSTREVTLLNRNGTVAAYVPAATTNFTVNGTAFANLFQSSGVNGGFPGLASGYIAIAPMAVYGCAIGGSGTTYDVTFINKNGAPAAGIKTGTTDLEVVGTVTASNLSGTNTGDQTITLTGNVTGSGTGSFATTIPAGTVTLAMQANMATASVVYRKTAGSGAPEVQTLATLKTDLGLTGTNSGDQTSIVGITGTIAQFNTACTDADFVPTGLATASGLTMSTGKLLGRSTAATGAIEELTALPAANFPALTGDVTTVAAALATTIAPNAVTYAKFQQVAASSLVGNATGSLANATGITLAGGLAFSGSTLTAAGALTPTSVASTGAVKSSGTGGVGYATGAGASVTQLTSKSTAPPAINKDCGQIVTNNAALAAAGVVSFTVSATARSRRPTPSTSTFSLVMRPLAPIATGSTRHRRRVVQGRDRKPQRRFIVRSADVQFRRRQGGGGLMPRPFDEAIFDELIFDVPLAIPPAGFEEYNLQRGADVEVIDEFAEVLTIAPQASTPHRMKGRVAVQIYGDALSFTGQVERSTRDPAGNPNWAPCGALISGSPYGGIEVTHYTEPTRAWWRLRVDQLDVDGSINVVFSTLKT
jgi:hypothetical protein